MPPSAELTKSAPVGLPGARWVWPVLVALVVALVAMAWWLNNRLYATQAEIAQRLQTATTDAIEAKTLTKQASDSVRDLTTRLAVLESRQQDFAAQRQALERLAPEYVEVPSGSRLRLDYGPEGVSLSVRLQEMFGQSDTPRVLDGREPVTLHLLSPARRPVQVTRDLAGFWRGSYAEVKKELKGRYPKHDWPDDPLHAAPSRGAKRKA